MQPSPSKTSGNLFAPLLYLLTGLAPFGVGNLLGGVAGYPLRGGVFFAGVLAVAALILVAGSNRLTYAPDAGRWPGLVLLAPERARTVAYGGVGLALVLGIILQLGAATGDWTIPLGGLGILGSYFYFAPPFKWHQRGWGEVVGGLCFGLLPVAAGLYLQMSHLLTEGLLYGLPLTFAGFNLFLIHGYPSPEAERPVPRHTLAARVGPVAGALIFTIINILIIFGLVVALLFPANPLPFRGGFILLIILALVNQELVKRKFYLKEARIKLLCWLTLAQHLGMSLVFILSLCQRL